MGAPVVGTGRRGNLMDVDLPAVHRRALARTGTIVAGVTSEQLGDATPCDGWDVATLLNHIVPATSG